MFILNSIQYKLCADLHTIYSLHFCRVNTNGDKTKLIKDPKHVHFLTDYVCSINGRVDTEKSTILLYNLIFYFVYFYLLMPNNNY